jgi:DNA processing protein
MIALTLMDGIGPRTAKTLLQDFKNVEEIFNDRHILLKDPFRKNIRLRQAIQRKTEALIKADQYLDYALSNDLDVITLQDDSYPKRLLNCPDSPIILYAKGTFEKNPKKTIAIVGTRNMTNYGKAILEELISGIKNYHIQVVSGLAYGVDVFAHKQCVQMGIETIGVLGHGLDRIYPALHKKVALEMVNGRGGLLTEFPNDTNPDRENFPQRNRIVAGMTDATIVVESGAKGGSLITANLANDYNREVFAYPGGVFNKLSEGCNQLIQANKAHLIRSSKDLIAMMEWQPEKEKAVVQKSLFEGLNDSEKSVVQLLLTNGESSVDKIASLLQKSISSILNVLLLLEMKGRVKSRPGSKYQLAMN